MACHEKMAKPILDLNGIKTKNTCLFISLTPFKQMNIMSRIVRKFPAKYCHNFEKDI
jgi:hypothetical protein